jgi:hypothetical protein
MHRFETPRVADVAATIPTIVLISLHFAFLPSLPFAILIKDSVAAPDWGLIEGSLRIVSALRHPQNERR